MMYKFSEKDLLLLKQSSNWATRSIHKLRTLFDHKYGEATRDILNKSVDVEDKLQNCWDLFVTSENKTQNDISAINEFVEVAAVMNSISFTISKSIIPMLKQEGLYQLKIDDNSAEINENLAKPMESNVDINIQKKEPVSKKDIEPGIVEKQISEIKDKPELRKAKKKKETTKDEIIKFLNDQYVQLTAFALEGETEEQTNARKNLAQEIFSIVGAIEDGSIKEPDVYSTYKEIVNKINSFLSTIKTAFSFGMNDKSIYKALIKNSNTIENIVAYSLLAEGAYNSLLTPLKEKWLSVKKHLPFADKNYDIYSFRKSCINQIKNLIKLNDSFLDIVEKAISIKDKEQKWNLIINSFNVFAENYNNSIDYFYEFYELLRRKAKLDYMKKTKKKETKENVENLSLKDFESFTWRDLPSLSKNKFIKIKLIEINE